MLDQWGILEQGNVGSVRALDPMEGVGSMKVLDQWMLDQWGMLDPMEGCALGVTILLGWLYFLV